MPKQFAEDSIDSLIKKNVKSLVLITAGFKEIGKEGEELEKRIVNKIKKAGARLVGPNCMGIISTIADIKLNATFVAEKPETGTTAFLSQSGALGAGILNSLRETDIKFAHFISVGNKADINENDVLNFWQGDDNIKTLTFYLESFVDGKNFFMPFVNGADKPAIVLKAGRTESGMKAASSHTGALSGKDKIVDALLKQFGIVRADNLNELFNTAKGFEFFKMPKGDRIAVVTNAGGPAILCVDKIDGEGLQLASFSDETKSRLREIVHPEGSVDNPVDLLPGGNAEIFKSVNEIICSDDNVDAVISIFVEPVMVSPFEVIENVYSIKNEKPILQVCMPLPEFWNKYREQSIYKLPVFKNPEDPAEVLANMLFYTRTKNKLNANKKNYLDAINLKTSNKFNSSSGFLSQREVNELCGEYNLPVIQSLFIKPNELQNIDDKLFPVVLKGINTKVIHKSELNAVKLNIKTKDELLIAASEIQKNFLNNNYSVDEFLVQPFIKTKHELLIGGFRDPSFGPIIMFGSGGKYVEVLDDSAIKSCYLCDEDVEDMIDSTKIGKILRGVRGELSCDIEQLKKIINSCANMMIENEKIYEFDLNPLIVDETNKFYAVDVRIKV